MFRRRRERRGVFVMPTTGPAIDIVREAPQGLPAIARLEIEEISANEATLAMLAAHPRARVRLSPEQAEAVRRIDAQARRDAER